MMDITDGYNFKRNLIRKLNIEKNILTLSSAVSVVLRL
jgi:hypothetical protein